MSTVFPACRCIYLQSSATLCFGLCFHFTGVQNFNAVCEKKFFHYCLALPIDFVLSGSHVWLLVWPNMCSLMIWS